MARYLCSRKLKKSHLPRTIRTPRSPDRRAPCTWTFLSSLLFGAWLLCPVSQAGAATPLEVVKSTNEAVLAIYGKHRLVDAAVEKEIFTVIDAVTDYQALSSGAIDPLCPQLSAAQCTSFKEIFTRLLRISSIKKLGRARAGRFEYAGEQVTGGSAVVRSFAFFNDEKVPLDYHMASRGDTWVIVNYVIDEVDTVKNYRKQFRSLLAKKPFEQVMDQLEKKIASLEAEE
jgi:phospholipid transport system substrate-binding protein